MKHLLAPLFAIILAFAAFGAFAAAPPIPPTVIPLPLPTKLGGTGATTAATARANIGAAMSGPNNDITALGALPNIVVGNLGCNGALTGATDVAAALNSALAALSTSSGGRGTYYLIDTGGCLVASAQILVVPGMTLKCSDSMPVMIPQRVTNYGSRACELGGSTSASSAVKVEVGGNFEGFEVVNPNLTPASVSTARGQLTMTAAFAGTGVLAPSDGSPAQLAQREK